MVGVSCNTNLESAKKVPLILHIGTYKTGSSSIQTFLTLNSARLAEQGVLYPDCLKNEVLDGHHLLAYSMGFGNPVLREKWKGWVRPEPAVILDEMHEKGCNRILISAEDFSSSLSEHHDDKIREMLGSLKKYLSLFDVRILVYLRRQDFYAASLYAEMIKSGHRLTFLIDELMQRTYLFDYDRVLRFWEECFGQDRITVQVFEKEQMPEGLFKSFTSHVGVEFDDQYFLPDRKASNVGLTPAYTEFLRICNEKIESSSQLHLVKQYLLGMSAEVGGSRRLPFSKAERIALLDRYKAGNQRIAREYKVASSGELFIAAAPDEDSSSASISPPSYLFDQVLKPLGLLGGRESNVFPKHAEKFSAKWKVQGHNIATLDRKRSGIVVTSTADDPQVHLSVPLSQVAGAKKLTFSCTVRSKLSTSVQFYWSDKKGQFSEQNSQRILLPDGGGRVLFFFNVQECGQCLQLRLDPDDGPGEWTLCNLSVNGLKVAPLLSRLRLALSTTRYGIWNLLLRWGRKLK